MKHKQLKYALFRSMAALLLCLVMWMGTTYAWMVDSVTSSQNIIQSGTLDVELQYAKADASITNIQDLEWKTVGPDDALFKEVGWVPSDMDMVYLRVVNHGEIDAKYQLTLHMYDETVGKNAENEEYRLSDYINGKVLDSDYLETANISTVENFRMYIDTPIEIDLEDDDPAVPLTSIEWGIEGTRVLDEGTVKAHSEDANTTQDDTISAPIAVLLGMPSVTSEANYKESDDSEDPYKYLSTFKLGISLVATQVEADIEE